MFDRELALEITRQITDAADKILNRFQPIEVVTDFTNTPAGGEKMDAICMLLIVIGESLKNLDKITAGTLLISYPEVEWKKAMGCAIFLPTTTPISTPRQSLTLAVTEFRSSGKRSIKSIRICKRQADFTFHEKFGLATAGGLTCVKRQRLRPR